MKAAIYSIIVLWAFSVQLLAQQTYSSSQQKKLNTWIDSAEYFNDHEKLNKLDFYIQKAEGLIDSGGINEINYRFFTYKGSLQLARRNVKSAHKSFFEALRIAKKIDKNIGVIYNYIANTLTTEGKLRESQIYYDSALFEARKANDYDQIVGIIFNSAIVDENLNDSYSALKKYTSIRDTLIKNDPNELLGVLENNLGELYRKKFQDFTNAKAHLKKSISYSTLYDKKHMLSLALHNLALTYLEEDSLDKAKEAAFKSVALKKAQNNYGGLASGYFLLGSYYAQSNNLDSALFYQKNALTIVIENEINAGLHHCHKSIGKTFLEMGEVDSAIFYFQNAVKFGEITGEYEDLEDVYFELHKAFKSKGQFKSSLEALELAHSLKDSVNLANNSSEIKSLKTKFETDLALIENESLREKQKAKEDELHYNRLLLFISLGFIVMLLIGAVSLNRSLKQRKATNLKLLETTEQLKVKNEKLKKQEKLLKASNTQKNRILSVLGHDLRGPLSSISALLGAISAKEINRNELQSLLALLKKENDITLNTLQDILRWARMQMNENILTKEKLAPYAFFKEWESLFDSNLREKNIKVEYYLKDGLQINADKNQLRSMFSNLLSNAIKFSPKNSEIEVSLKEDNGFAVITVIDHGPGIKDSIINNLNTRAELKNESGSEGEVGNGIGLRIVSDFVDAHLGHLRFERLPEGGTKAMVSLPLA